MSTLREAIEKVGVRGKVKNYDGTVVTVLQINKNHAWIETNSEKLFSVSLDDANWTPVLPKKRVVLQAWECGDHEIQWFEVLPDCYSLAYKRRKDIANMIFEDGKQVFDADA